MLLLFSASIPAEAPPNLSATMGAAVMVTRNRYQNDRFSLEYPTGWRVITSPAGAPPNVTLVAPGNCALIEVSSTPLDRAPDSPSCDQPDIRPLLRTVGAITSPGARHRRSGTNSAPPLTPSPPRSRTILDRPRRFPLLALAAILLIALIGRIVLLASGTSRFTRMRRSSA